MSALGSIAERLRLGSLVAIGRYERPEFGWIARVAGPPIRLFGLVVLLVASYATLNRLISFGNSTTEGSGPAFTWLTDHVPATVVAAILSFALTLTVLVRWLWRLAEVADLMDIRCLVLTSAGTLKDAPELLDSKTVMVQRTGEYALQSVSAVFVNRDNGQRVETTTDMLLKTEGNKVLLHADEQVLCWVTPSSRALRALASKGRHDSSVKRK